MPPIIGIYASQISGHLAPPITGSYDALAVYTVPSGGASSITFAGIPQSGYQHLQIRWAVHDTGAAVGANVIVTTNNATTGYSFHQLTGTGSSAGANGSANSSNMYLGVYVNNTTVLQPGVLDILDYGNNNKYKTFRCLSGGDNNGSGYIYLTSGSWRSTDAITSISLITDNGNWGQYSSFALYGIRG